ncbi:uncharacterized protein [Amphiura filiformis]|uniref:uncharacterized protein n=1 Tax=Amphiura filiformis TaxID=82378 RepID=UPI003B20DE4B
MYPITVYLINVIAAITLASLFTQMVKAFPALEDEAVRIVQLTSISNAPDEETLLDDDDNGQMQYEHTSKDNLEDAVPVLQMQYTHTRKDDLEDAVPVFQKCKRNKRHVHTQKINQQDTTWEENAETGSTESPLTDEQILDIELQYHIERIKQKILSKLHLDQPPNVTASKQQIPPELLRKVMSADGNRRSQAIATLDDATADDDISDADAGKITQIIVIAENGTGECDFPNRPSAIVSVILQVQSVATKSPRLPFGSTYCQIPSLTAAPEL